MKKIPNWPRIDHALNYAHTFLMLSRTIAFPIDPFSIAERCGIRVLSDQVVANMAGLSREKVLAGREADCWLAEGDYTIIYDESIQSQQRIRWSIMHEIGHIALNHHTDFPEQLHYRKHLGRHHYRVLEREANAFVAEVMAPISVIKHCELFDETAIARCFDISFEAAKIQLHYLNNQGHKEFFRGTDDYMVAQFEDFIKKMNPFFKPKQGFYFSG